jgi:hypothetical protein
MSKLFVCMLAVGVCLGTTAMLSNSKPTSSATANSEARFATDGAFRDGMFLGRLAGERGQPRRPAIGRWSTDQDRSMFAAGYRRGYEKSLAAARATSKLAQSTE